MSFGLGCLMLAEQKTSFMPVTAGLLQRAAINPSPVHDVPPIVPEVLRSTGQPLDAATRAFMEPRFGHDFSGVRVHIDAKAAGSARAVNALAYTVGRDVVFDAGQYQPTTNEGRRLMAHELTHVVQQNSTVRLDHGLVIANDVSPEERSAEATSTAIMAGQPIGSFSQAAPMIQRRAAPYIKKITVHLTPPQKAELEWQGTPPADATGSDSFPVSTGKGYSDPGDPAGTCTRNCCNDPMTQCAPPWNKPTQVGACCTYYGNDFWTGIPLDEHNGWKWWTPIQPYYSSRGIALHQHTEVTGEPIGHGCVRMDEPNAKRIYDYSNGRSTNVTIDGRAAPVHCDQERRCAGTGKSSDTTGALEESSGGNELAMGPEVPIPGLEGQLT